MADIYTRMGMPVKMKGKVVDAEGTEWIRCEWIDENPETHDYPLSSLRGKHLFEEYDKLPELEL